MAKIKLPKRSPTGAVKKRARRMGRRRMRKDFGRRLMKGFGLSAVYDEQQEKSVRDFKRTLAFGALKGKLQDNVVDEPPLDTPETEQNVSNPDISALNEQLKKVLKTAKAMGLVDKETQDLTMKQLRAANRAAKENQLETPIEPQAVPEPQEGTGNAISPLADKMEDLIKAFEDLIDTVEDKNKDDKKTFMDRLSEGLGLGDVRREYKEKPAKLREGFTTETTKSGKVRYKGPDNAYTTPEKALKGGYSGGYAKGQIVKEAQAARVARGTAQPSIMSRAGDVAKKAISPVTGLASKAGGVGAAALSKTAAVGGMATSKIAKGIKAGVGATRGAAVKGSALTGQALKTAITKVAGPKIGKALATTGIKSIPVLGAIAGLGFAASRLADGDFLGAGLDAVSGLAGPVTAIPAMVASLSRDIYSEVFGTQPETDPQFGERMSMVQGTVKSLVENQIGKKVQPKGSAVGPGAEKKAAPPVAVKQTGSAPSSQAAANPPPPPQAAPSGAVKPVDDSRGASTSAAAAPAAASSVPAAPPKVATGGSGSAPSVGSTDGATQAPVVQNQPSLASPKIESKTATVVPPATTTGSQIAAATDAAEKVGMPKPRVGTATAPIRPATKPTTKTGARGMGNVPDPTYFGVGSIAKQLYFSASI